MNREEQIASGMVVGSQMKVSMITTGDHRRLVKVVEEVMQDIVGELSVKVSVDFEYGWNGRHRPATQINPEEDAEFEAYDEKVSFKPGIATISEDDIINKVTEKNDKEPGQYDNFEDIALPDFRRAITEVIVGNKWELEDLDVELPGAGSARSDIAMKLQLIGEAIRVEFSMSHDNLQKIMKHVDNNAADWYPAPNNEVDRAEYLQEMRDDMRRDDGRE